MLCCILPIDDSWSQDGAGWAEEELERGGQRRSWSARAAAGPCRAAMDMAAFSVAPPPPKHFGLLYGKSIVI
jgi:hypothetical protein